MHNSYTYVTHNSKMKHLYLKKLFILISLVTIVSCQKKDDITEDSIVWENNKEGVFTDSRDNQAYKIVKIGNQVLFAENLKYQIPGKEITDKTEWKSNFDYDGWSFYWNDLNTGNSYGILYQWEAAKSACPNGWHLITNNEWDELINYLGDENNTITGNEYIALGKLKETGTEHWYGTNEKVTNESGFTALGGGYRDSDGDFRSILIAGHFWTSTPYTTYNENTEAYLRSMGYTDGNIVSNYSGKINGLSVRCIKD